MSDTRGLLDRISAFRQRLDATPQLVPDAVPVEVEPAAIAAEAEAFRLNVRRLSGAPEVAPAAAFPQFTDRAKRSLAIWSTLKRKASLGDKECPSASAGREE